MHVRYLQSHLLPLYYVRLQSVEYFFFSSRRRHTRLQGDWSSDVCSSDLDDDGLRAHIAECVRAACDDVDDAVLNKMTERTSMVAGDYSDPSVFTRLAQRSEERRVGKEGRSRWSPYH